MILESLSRHLETVAAEAPAIRQIQEQIGHPGDLTIPQYLSWLAICLDFKPDVIVELGRGYGNSTVLFTIAAHRLPGLAVHSFDLREFWESETRPKLERITPPGWFAPLTIHTGNLTRFDFSTVLALKQRILVLLDAHGFAVAERLLAHILPLIAERRHLILCHDLSDNRFSDPLQRSYNGRRFWRGMEDWYDNSNTTAYVNLGWTSGIVDQVIPILDFCFRNSIELHSADYDFAVSAKRDPELLGTLTPAIPEINGDTRFHFAWFTLNEGSPPFSFPTALPGGIRLRTKARNAWLYFVGRLPWADRFRKHIKQLLETPR